MADPAQLRGVALQHLEHRIRIGRYLDLPAICVEGWHARAALSAMRNKTDKAPQVTPSVPHTPPIQTTFRFGLA
jgi:hypothetical protein